MSESAVPPPPLPPLPISASMLSPPLPQHRQGQRKLNPPPGLHAINPSPPSSNDPPSPGHAPQMSQSLYPNSALATSKRKPVDLVPASGSKNLQRPTQEPQTPLPLMEDVLAQARVGEDGLLFIPSDAASSGPATAYSHEGHVESPLSPGPVTKGKARAVSTEGAGGLSSLLAGHPRLSVRWPKRIQSSTEDKKDKKHPKATVDLLDEGDGLEHPPSPSHIPVLPRIGSFNFAAPLGKLITGVTGGGTGGGNESKETTPKSTASKRQTGELPRPGRNAPVQVMPPIESVSSESAVPPPPPLHALLTAADQSPEHRSRNPYSPSNPTYPYLHRKDTPPAPTTISPTTHVRSPTTEEDVIAGLIRERQRSMEEARRDTGFLSMATNSSADDDVQTPTHSALDASTLTVETNRNNQGSHETMFNPYQQSDSMSPPDLRRHPYSLHAVGGPRSSFSEAREAGVTRRGSLGGGGNGTSGGAARLSTGMYRSMATGSVTSPPAPPPPPPPPPPRARADSFPNSAPPSTMQQLQQGFPPHVGMTRTASNESSSRTSVRRLPPIPNQNPSASGSGYGR